MKNAKIQLDKKFTILDRDAERCVGIKLFFLWVPLELVLDE